MPKYTQQLDRRSNLLSQQANNSSINPYYLPADAKNGRVTRNQTKDTANDGNIEVTNKSSNVSIFKKIKGFFSTNDRNKNTTSNNIRATEKQQITKPKLPFDNVSVSNIDLSLNSNMSFISKNPNDTLSEFFNRKGDQPLNDIEVEGVLSLIKKSQTLNSRAPSRNTSMMSRNGDHSNMFLNSYMEYSRSRLNPGASFNEMNNTTILRQASKDLKQPVRIKTPTFKSKSRTAASTTTLTPDSRSASVSKANRTISNITNTSMNTSNLNPNVTTSNISRSFVANGGIRKRRIVDYTKLQSPYKTKMHSPLAAFLEKKKNLETETKTIMKSEQGDESKLANSEGTSTDSKHEKKSLSYTGGAINLSNLCGEDDIPSFTTEQPKMSKTASKLLSIISTTEIKTTPKELQKAEIEQKPTETIKSGPVSASSAEKSTPESASVPALTPTLVDNDIIIIDDDDSIVEAPAPVDEPPKKAVATVPALSFKPETTTPVFKFQVKTKEADTPPLPLPTKIEEPKPTFSFNNKPAEQITGIPKTGLSFMTTFKKEEQKSDKPASVINTKPTAVGFEPSSSISTNHSKQITTETPKLDTKPLFTPASVSSKEENEDDIEHIDAFTFPSVSEPASQLPLTPMSSAISTPSQLANGTTADFEFPQVAPVSPQTLSAVAKLPAAQYDDIFQF